MARYLVAARRDGGAARQLVGDGIFRANGCGGEGGIPVPDGNWVDACNQHDDCYDGIGGYSSYSRLACDNLLFNGMVSSGPIGALFAPIYWLVVRLGGSSNYTSTGRTPAAAAHNQVDEQSPGDETPGDEGPWDDGWDDGWGDDWDDDWDDGWDDGGWDDDPDGEP